MMEENHPPAKKLKQATLLFFKENKEKTVLKIPPSTSQGKKRRNSDSSESPSKVVKLSKPLKVLITSDSPNVKQCKPEPPPDDDVQEVSSSSEAENPVSVKSNAGRCCLLERFVKKVPHNGQQEISSTNNELDLSTENTTNNCDESKHEPSLSKSVLEEGDTVEDGDSEVSFRIEKDSNEDGAAKSTTKNIGTKESAGNISIIDIEEGQNISIDHSNNDNAVQDNAEEGNVAVLETSLSESSSGKPFTSTPLKPESSSGGRLPVTPVVQQSPLTPATSSSKKRGRKVDTAKKAEKEAEKEKLRQEREAKRLERKRKLEEEKSEKERIRKEQQAAREKAKEELREKQNKEKLEKEKIKEDERKKKEEERLRKEEEKQKKLAVIELKQEEKKKKEEEKKRKEEEKLKEEEIKTKQAEKVKTVFKSFFVKQADVASKQMPVKTSSGLFIPFELKKDMHLAPTLWRAPLSEKKKSNLDSLLSSKQPDTDCNHYLMQLQSGTLKPHHTGRILRKNPQPADELDLEIIHDSEALKKVFHKVKLLQFHTDNRPPYYGTWRKETKLSAKNPFKTDEDMFDYEVDSDDEWEEEEPGESLSCSDGEDDKGDENEDDEEDGWMVPHGYLSEDEGCNEDDEITPEKLKLQQQAKAKAWEEEQKRKLHASPMVVVGCFFEYSPSEAMSGDVRLLYEFQAVVLVPDIPIATSLSGVLDAEKEEPQADVPQQPQMKGPKRQAVPDEAMPDLIRLVHGNLYGIKKLVKEFRVFWLLKCNSTLSESNALEDSDPDESMRERQVEMTEPNDSVNETTDSSKLLDKSCDTSLVEGVDRNKEEGYGCEISKRQLEKKIMAMAVRERRSVCKKIAWYVHDPVLAEFNMSGLELPNTWEYLTAVPARSPAPNSTLSTANKQSADAMKTEEPPEVIAPTPNDQRSIKDFTLSKKELEIRGENLVSSTLENPSCKSKEMLLSESGPSHEKKNTGQRSIMDFALSKKETTNEDANSSSKLVDDLHVTTKPSEKAKEKKVNNQPSIIDFAKAKTAYNVNRTPTFEQVPKSREHVVIIIDENTDHAEFKAKSGANFSTTESNNTKSTELKDHEESISAQKLVTPNESLTYGEADNTDKEGKKNTPAPQT